MPSFGRIVYIPFVMHFWYSEVMDTHKKSLLYLSRKDPILRAVIKNAKLEPIKARKKYFYSLVRAIVGQQLSTKAANSIFKKFVASFGNNFPKPEQVLKKSDSELRKVGLSFGKIAYLKNLSQAVFTGELNFKKLVRATDEEVIAELTKIKGIGRWTAEMFLIFSLGRPNVFSEGDLGLRNAIKKLYNIDPKVHTKSLKKLLDNWHPYKSSASRHLWASLSLDKKKTNG